MLDALSHPAALAVACLLSGVFAALKARGRLAWPWAIVLSPVWALLLCYGLFVAGVLALMAGVL